MIKSRIAAGAALLAVAGAANAGSFTVTPTITNDYDFRGVTQTDENFAAQLGGTYSFDSGFYLGAWGSNVDFTGDDSGIEIDYYGGYAGMTESFNYDLGAIYYSYSGFTGASDANTLEVYAGISKDWLSGKISYSDDVASSGESGFYIEGAVAYPLPNNFSLLAHVGFAATDALEASTGDDSYMDYAAGVGYSYNNFNLAVKYVDNDLPGSDGRVVATLSTTLPWASE